MPLLQHLRRDQRGTSLAELLVALALTAIVTTLVVTIVATSSRTLSGQSLAASNSETAALAMREVSRVVRSGAPVRLAGSTIDSPVVTVAGANSLTVTSFVDTVATAPVPVRVTFTVTAGRLTEQRFTMSAVAGGWQVASVGSATRTLARGVASTAARPVFSFVDAAGASIPIPTGSTIAAVDLPRIAAVRIRVAVQGDASGRAISEALDNTVGLPNLGISRVRVGG